MARAVIIASPGWRAGPMGRGPSTDLSARLRLPNTARRRFPRGEQPGRALGIFGQGPPDFRTVLQEPSQAGANGPGPRVQLAGGPVPMMGSWLLDTNGPRAG